MTIAKTSAKRTGSYKNYGRANKSPARIRTAVMKLRIDAGRALQNREIQGAELQFVRDVFEQTGKLLGTESRSSLL